LSENPTEMNELNCLAGCRRWWCGEQLRKAKEVEEVKVVKEEESKSPCIRWRGHSGLFGSGRIWSLCIVESHDKLMAVIVVNYSSDILMLWCHFVTWCVVSMVVWFFCSLFVFRYF